MASLYPTAVGIEPITRFTQALAAAASEVPGDTPIPSCDGWTMNDLVWHLTQVQDFWSYMIANRPKGPDNYDRPPRPSDPRLVANLRNALVGLTSTLETAAVTDPAWSWAAEQTVGFTLRRQTHEALTHCVDAVQAAGLELPDVSPELAADGIDEVVHVMLREADADQTGTMTLQTSDTDDSWTVRIGDGDATVTGRALDINLWLWGRANTWPLSITGATDQAEVLRATIASGTH